MTLLPTFLLFFAIYIALGVVSAPVIFWTAATAGLIAATAGFGASVYWLWAVFAAVALLVNVTLLRRMFVSRPLMNAMIKGGFVPKISTTEQEALKAGNVGLEAELFSGRPDLKKLFRAPLTTLSAEEQSFLDNEIEEICASCNDWDVFQKRDLPPVTWKLMREMGVFGMIIPKAYGGKEFSATLVSTVIDKLSSRSIPLGITGMLPNSLGPGELLSHYGTQEQKDYWLPRLSGGKEIPAFALTEPNAGSDAGSITSRADVYRDDEGEIKLRLNWSKRYITMANRATVLGWAVKLFDPQNLLGRGEKPGITCVLTPTDNPAVNRKKQHDPLGVPFFNCPTSGKDVIVGPDAIIGGPAGAGRGWVMLMECLAAGRGVMLPAQATTGTKMAARVCGSYSMIRQQFGMSIGKFQGIAEPLARIGGKAYILEAARLMNTGQIDAGIKSSVSSALAKYYFTETMRETVNDGMDIMGGAAISRGPRNLMASAYIGTPISITVEGANILTRTLMIFGQGSLRCHPFAFQVLNGLIERDSRLFDRAIWGHVGHIIGNACRSAVYGITRGHLAPSPVGGPARRYWQKLAWASSGFAFTADLAMVLYGADMKRQQMLAGRFADAFGWMFMAASVLRRFEADGALKEDVPYMQWSMEHCLKRVDDAMHGAYDNFHAPLMGFFFRGPLAWFYRANPISAGPTDYLSQKIAKLMQTPGDQRERLCNNAFMPKGDDEHLPRLEEAFVLVTHAAEVIKKIRAAQKAKKLDRGRPTAMLEAALAADVITADDVKLMADAAAARDDAIQVDSFTEAEYLATAADGGWGDGDGMADFDLS